MQARKAYRVAKEEAMSADRMMWMLDDLQVVVSLPEVPPLLHLPHHLPCPILHQHAGRDPVEGPPHSEQYLGTCVCAQKSAGQYM